MRAELRRRSTHPLAIDGPMSLDPLGFTVPVLWPDLCMPIVRRQLAQLVHTGTQRVVDSLEPPNLTNPSEDLGRWTGLPSRRGVEGDQLAGRAQQRSACEPGCSGMIDNPALHHPFEVCTTMIEGVSSCTASVNRG
jgi:hypothetical protein